ncbi:MAG: DUF1761 domain-containing protein [Actinobacteria bacterium]|nr:DUF1761 domain-containing protein [Actinomycetota bacterium]
MQEIELNWLAVAVAALVPMALGALWYSLLFARPWMRAVGRSAEDMSGASIGYGLSAIAALVTSYTLARVVRWAEVDDLANGVLVGLLLWIGFVATIIAVQTYFGGRSRTLWAIDAGYWLVSLLVMGAIHGAWE